MCGIVGLFLKDKGLEPQLGALTAGMLGTMCERGPDSAGFALYSPGRDGEVKLTLRGGPATDFARLETELRDAVGPLAMTRRDTHAVIALPEAAAGPAIDWLKANAPDVSLAGRGRRMELFKEVGSPDKVADRFGLAAMAGSHAISHTRMATESAVTIDGAHPFSTGPDQCLVHNGSLSNHNNVRRNLIREGLRFETENDSEVAAGYLTWRLREGLTLGEALTACLDDLDGFYTFVVGTENGFGVLRDGIACKPAVMAETDRYVAFGSEYRALARLPDIGTARVWEPDPATVYFWERG
ncbi:MAG: glutamine amidotransferase family protein [Rhodomicrobium sp.]|nr:glutamine amidotransferase family protein [Rhodomicrobium sp.]